MDATPYQKIPLGIRIRTSWRRSAWRRIWEDYNWLVITVVVIITAIPVLLLVWLFFDELFKRAKSGYSFYSNVLKVLSIPFYTIATYKFFITIFRNEAQAIKLKLAYNHAVVCGVGNKAALFTKAFYKDGFKVVLISNDKNTSKLEQFQNLGILVLAGDPTDKELLRKARVQEAQYLVAVCENDGDNAEIAINARTLVSGSPDKVLTCLLHITNPQVCTLLKEREIMGQQVHSFRMEFLNVFESGAWQLLKEFPGFGESVRTSQPHLLIVGLGPMGKSLTVHAGMLWRSSPETSQDKLPITIVDKDADRKKQFLELHYRHLNDFWDLIPVSLDTDSPQFYEAKFLRDGDGRCIITMVYVCLDDDARSLAAALALFQQLRQEEVPIVVQMDTKAGLAKLLQDEEKGGGSFANLHSFGLLDQKCKTDLLMFSTHEMLARAIHQDYVLRQTNLGQTPETNPALVPWDELSNDLKESNRRQADDYGNKLKRVHCDMKPLTDWDAELFEFTPEEIEILARMEHERWLQERRNAGWTYAPGAKDLEHKKSPSLVEWEALPEDMKKENREEIRRLPVFLAGAGFQIFRTPPKDQNGVKGA